MHIETSPLGKQTHYPSTYDKSLLFAFPRKLQRDLINVALPLPFSGYDLLNAYEFSWLDLNQKPVVKIAEILVNCDSECLVENKSLKLYLNSFSNSCFKSEEEVLKVLHEDLMAYFKGKVMIKLYDVMHVFDIRTPDGINIDHHAIVPNFEEVQSALLVTKGVVVEETLHSNLLKSNCLVTGQPDWGTIEISYRGPQIDQAGLLSYLISFRNQATFMENCIERIFMDISQRCAPEKLSVYGRYCRRGGIDINPIRSSYPGAPPSNSRFSRQ